MLAYPAQVNLPLPRTVRFWWMLPLAKLRHWSPALESCFYLTRLTGATLLSSGGIPDISVSLVLWRNCTRFWACVLCKNFLCQSCNMHHWNSRTGGNSHLELKWDFSWHSPASWVKAFCRHFILANRWLSEIYLFLENLSSISIHLFILRPQ